jgi:DNA-binding response OmpR family regulator
MPSSPKTRAGDAPVRLLVAEDDAAVAASLVTGLKARGFDVTLATSGTQARVELARDVAQLVVLDLMLPGVSGLELLEELSTRPHAPVIVLTARTDLEERVRCFQLGAVDYVPKPFFLEELVLRIRARLDLRDEAPRRVLAFGALEVDLDQREVRLEGVPVTFTRHEFDVLAYLAQRPGRPVSRDDLAAHALSGFDAPEPRTIDSHVARVRRKLGDEAARLETVWGIGYRLVAGAS